MPENRAVHLNYARRPSALRYMARGMLPVRRRRSLVPAISASWRDYRVDPAELASFLRITGLQGGPTLPLLYPHTVGFRLVMAILTHTSFPVPIWGVLQTRNNLVQHQPIAIDARLNVEARVQDGRVVAKGAEFDLATTVHVAGQLAWQSTTTFFTRGRFGEAGPEHALARAPAVAAPSISDWTLRDADHTVFGRLTGDYNGIHLADWYAKRFGFRRALYHPPRVLGECLARLPPLDDRVPQRLDAWLKGPVPHGATVQLHSASDRQATTFALFAGDERPCIVGRLGKNARNDHSRGPS
jgi:hypothetical protein